MLTKSGCATTSLQPRRSTAWRSFTPNIGCCSVVLEPMISTDPALPPHLPASWFVRSDRAPRPALHGAGMLHMRAAIDVIGAQHLAGQLVHQEILFVQASAPRSSKPMLSGPYLSRAARRPSAAAFSAVSQSTSTHGPRFGRPRHPLQQILAYARPQQPFGRLDEVVAVATFHAQMIPLIGAFSLEVTRRTRPPGTSSLIFRSSWQPTPQ